MSPSLYTRGTFYDAKERKAQDEARLEAINANKAKVTVASEAQESKRVAEGGGFEDSDDDEEEKEKPKPKKAKTSAS